jgi:NAD(P)-binding Rossmann-like domain
MGGCDAGIVPGRPGLGWNFAGVAGLDRRRLCVRLTSTDCDHLFCAGAMRTLTSEQRECRAYTSKCPCTGVLIAGAGIGGLTAALALARRGIAVTLFDQAERLEETGAGIQLSPNATRALVALATAKPIACRIRRGPCSDRFRRAGRWLKRSAIMSTIASPSATSTPARPRPHGMPIPSDAACAGISLTSRSRCAAA